MRRGFRSPLSSDQWRTKARLVATMDWTTRKVLSWRLSNGMDGKGAWHDNRMIERLWRSLKHECVYLNAFETGSDARAGIRKWMTCYNCERPHSTHGLLTPDEAYESKTEPTRLAA